MIKEHNKKIALNDMKKTQLRIKIDFKNLINNIREWDISKVPLPDPEHFKQLLKIVKTMRTEHKELLEKREENEAKKKESMAKWGIELGCNSELEVFEKTLGGSIQAALAEAKSYRRLITCINIRPQLEELSRKYTAMEEGLIDAFINNICELRSSYNEEKEKITKSFDEEKVNWDDPMFWVNSLDLYWQPKLPLFETKKEKEEIIETKEETLNKIREMHLKDELERQIEKEKEEKRIRALELEELVR